MKPEDVIVRFRQPTGNDPVNNVWQNNGEARWFKSFKAAWSFIRDCEGYHPLTGDLLNGQELVETVHRSKIEDSGIYYLDVFGKSERTERNKQIKIRSKKWQQQ